MKNESDPTLSGFYIVNEVDRPNEEHIAERRKDDKFYYAHPRLRNDKRYWGMTATNPTPIEDFGMIVDVKGGMLVGAKDESTPVKSTYSDGRPRQWQGSQIFSFPFQKTTKP